MLSARKKKTKGGSQKAQTSHSGGEIHQYFLSPPAASPMPKMAEPRGQGREALVAEDPPVSPAGSTASEVHSDNAEQPHTSIQNPQTQPYTLRADAELRSLLQALPTKEDITALISSLEESQRQAIQAVRSEVCLLSDRLTSEESSVAALKKRVTILETHQALQADTAVTLQLQMESMEDRSRRNNLRLRGLPEATDRENLPETAAAVFRSIVGDSLPSQLEFDRIHRALGPRSNDPNRPRDVICRLHHYTHKEVILSKAWEVGEVDFDGAMIKILPDVSRATLQRRALMRPILEIARRRGFTYRWGYPLSVTFRKDHRFCSLHNPDDLPAFFELMESDPVSVPNWLLPLPRPSGRLGPAAPPPRQQRPRRRSRTRPPGDVREP